MSNLEAATKVADQLVSRLFDHRQFSAGELAYLAREFAVGARLEQRLDQLLRINEKVCLIGDLARSAGASEARAADEAPLEALRRSVSSLADRAQQVLDSTPAAGRGE